MRGYYKLPLEVRAIRIRPCERARRNCGQHEPIRLLLADVDGTLVTQDKVLTERAIAAVKKLKAAGILFAVTSGRPPRGMSMLIDPLEITTPIAAFNGGVFARPDMSVIEQRTIPDDVTPVVIELLDGHGVERLGLPRGRLVCAGPQWHHTWTGRPGRSSSTRRWSTSFASVSDGVAKIVGVSDDYDAVQAAVDAVRAQFGDHVSAARSQPYYADVTHPEANKGGVVRYLSRTVRHQP